MNSEKADAMSDNFESELDNERDFLTDGIDVMDGTEPYGMPLYYQQVEDGKRDSQIYTTFPSQDPTKISSFSGKNNSKSLVQGFVNPSYSPRQSFRESLSLTTDPQEPLQHETTYQYMSPRQSISPRLSTRQSLDDMNPAWPPRQSLRKSISSSTDPQGSLGGENTYKDTSHRQSMSSRLSARQSLSDINPACPARQSLRESISAKTDPPGSLHQENNTSPRQSISPRLSAGQRLSDINPTCPPRQSLREGIPAQADPRGSLHQESTYQYKSPRQSISPRLSAPQTLSDINPACPPRTSLRERIALETDAQESTHQYRSSRQSISPRLSAHQNLSDNTKKDLTILQTEEFMYSPSFEQTATEASLEGQDQAIPQRIMSKLTELEYEDRPSFLSPLCQDALSEEDDNDELPYESPPDPEDTFPHDIEEGNASEVVEAFLQQQSIISTTGIANENELNDGECIYHDLTESHDDENELYDQALPKAQHDENELNDEVCVYHDLTEAFHDENELNDEECISHDLTEAQHDGSGPVLFEDKNDLIEDSLSYPYKDDLHSE